MEGLFGMEQPSRFERDQLSCLLLEDYGGRRTEAKLDPVGPSGHKSVSVCPISYLKEKGFQLPRPSTSSKGHIQTVANRAREGRQEETLLQQGAWCWFLLW